MAATTPGQKTRPAQPDAGTRGLSSNAPVPLAGLPGSPPNTLHVHTKSTPLPPGTRPPPVGKLADFCRRSVSERVYLARDNVSGMAAT